MRVSLVSPFPELNLPDLFHWLECSMISKSGEFPADLGAFERLAKEGMGGTKTWGVYHEGDLIGAIIFEPVGLMGGRSYVASSRAVWGSGLMDEAAREGISLVFEMDQRMSYIFGMVVANNAPAIAFNERVGMRLKNILPNYGIQGGRIRNMMIFEITREKWENREIFERTRPKWTIDAV